jgi:hypothetical protein
MSAEVARSPSMIATGSPGTRWLIENTRRETPINAGTASPRRFRI